MDDDGAGSAYAKLIAKVDRFHTEVEGRSPLACCRGCDACCRVELSVCAVEASRIDEYLRAAEDGVRSRVAARAQAARSDPPRCVMLDDEGSCAVYAVRPMVCRTQGMALRYPPRTFPEDAVMARDGAGSDIVWCPLNYRDTPPEGRDVLEAGRLDEMLALINLDHVGGDRNAAGERVDLRSLALRSR